MTTHHRRRRLRRGALSRLGTRFIAPREGGCWTRWPPTDRASTSRSGPATLCAAGWSYALTWRCDHSWRVGTRAGVPTHLALRNNTAVSRRALTLAVPAFGASAMSSGDVDRPPLTGAIAKLQSEPTASTPPMVWPRQLAAPGAANQCAERRVREMPAEPVGADDWSAPVRGCLVKVTAVRARYRHLAGSWRRATPERRRD